MALHIFEIVSLITGLPHGAYHHHLTDGVAPGNFLTEYPVTARPFHLSLGLDLLSVLHFTTHPANLSHMS